MLRHSDTQARHENIDANGRLCDFAKRLGYPYEGDGICAGVAYVGIQLFLQGQLPLFNRLVTYIVAQDADDLYQALHDVKERIKQSGHVVSKRDRLLLNVLVFFDMVMLHQMPEEYTAWYKQGSLENTQAVYHVLSGDVKNTEATVTRINHWLRHLTSSQFRDFLVGLNQQANKHKLDVALYFGANDHGIAYCYRHATQSWLIIDANSLPVYRFKSTPFNRRARHLMQALFSKNDTFLLSVDGYAKKGMTGLAMEWLRALWRADLFRQAMMIQFTEMNKAQIRDLLSTAAIFGHVDVINQAIKAGHRKLLNKEYDGKTLAALAATYNHANVIDKLARVGVNLNARTKDAYTPLMLAALHGSANAVEAILKTGKVKKYAVSPLGDTAAMLAAESGYIDILKVLSRYHYDFEHVSADGRTVLDVAINFQQSAVIHYLYSLSPRQRNPHTFFQPHAAITSGSQKQASVDSVHTLRSGF